MIMMEIISWSCLILGALLSIIGGIGMHRFPDFYSRMHAASTADTLCAALILLGLGLHAELSLTSLKLLLVFAFLLFTSPTATHALANAALHGGLKPQLDGDNSKV